MVSEVESALERALSAELMSSGTKIALSRLDPGELLTEQGAVAGDELYLLLDGVMRVEVDGKAVTDIAPRALLGERAALEGSRRTARCVRSPSARWPPPAGTPWRVTPSASSRTRIAGRSSGSRP